MRSSRPQAAQNVGFGAFVWVLGTGAALVILYLAFHGFSSKPPSVDPGEEQAAEEKPLERKKSILDERIEEPGPPARAEEPAPPPPEPEPVFAPPPIASPETQPAVAAKKPRAKADGLRVSASTSDAPANLFTLSLAGTLGSGQIDADDKQTWGRLAYFLSQESPQRYYLVFPNGSIPAAVKDKDLKKGSPAKAPPGPGPRGDPSAPAYRLVLEAKSQAGGAITFYGQQMASKYECRIDCRIEARDGDGFKHMDAVTIEQKITPAKGTKASVEELLREVYDAAIEQLAKTLASRALFQTGTTSVNPSTQKRT
jgi:hypothetical protein